MVFLAEQPISLINWCQPFRGTKWNLAAAEPFSSEAHPKEGAPQELSRQEALPILPAEEQEREDDDVADGDEEREREQISSVSSC